MCSLLQVPIIKCQERYSGISMDISFNNISGLESARVVKEYLNTVPALKELTIVIKHFLMLKNLHDAAFGGLGSYSIVIMVLHFLQVSIGSFVILIGICKLL